MGSGEEFKTDRREIDMEIGSESAIELEYKKVEEGEEVLRVVEGEEVEIRCTADHGYPGHSFVWTGPTPGVRRVRKYAGERQEEERWAGNISRFGEVMHFMKLIVFFKLIFAGHPFL